MIAYLHYIDNRYFIICYIIVGYCIRAWIRWGRRSRNVTKISTVEKLSDQVVYLIFKSITHFYNAILIILLMIVTVFMFSWVVKFLFQFQYQRDNTIISQVLVTRCTVILHSCRWRYTTEKYTVVKHHYYWYQFYHTI